jgi:uncharacterized phage-associated protein
MSSLSAHDVAAELRRRVPGIGTKKLHKLLYYCQGHHLAALDEPLFAETISAWDMGPVVGALWKQEREGDVPSGHAQLNERQLNTIGYVVSRYGSLNGTDLEHLTHNESPWRDADAKRVPGGSVKITQDAIRNYFLTAPSDEGDEDTPLPDSEAILEWLASAGKRSEQVAKPDTVEALRARLSWTVAS